MGKKENTAKVRKRRQFLRHLIRCNIREAEKKVRLDEMNKKSQNVASVTGLKSRKVWGYIKKSAANASLQAVYAVNHLTPAM